MTLTTTNGPSETVVPFGKPSDYDKKLASAFMKLEPELNDLNRMCDLAMHTYQTENLDKEEISDNGVVTLLVLEHLTERAKKLRALWYELHKSAS